MNDPVIIVYPTIMDGTVVRWYASEAAAERRREVLSASRNGVIVDGYLHDVQPLLEAAQRVHEQLARNDRTDMKHLATHTRRLGGQIERVSA